MKGGYNLATDLTLKYNEHTISNENVRSIIKVCKEKLNCPPSYPITLFHYEGYWGNSNVAKLNNNWGGMSWSNNWTSLMVRSSGVTITKGSKRPNIEGGYYIKYNSFEDYFIDWAWLMRRAGNYRVADTKTFEDSIKGMFIYGGATRDYATMNVNNSKERYTLYLKNMISRRKSINEQNNGLLDKIDTGDYIWGDEPIEELKEYPDVVYPIIRDLESMLYSVQNEFSSFQKKIYNNIMDSLRLNLYQLSENKFGNKYVRIDKLLDNMYILQPNFELDKSLTNTIKNTNETIKEYNGDIEDISHKGNNHVADKEDKEIDYPFFPTTKGLRISSKYGYRGNITGVPNASKFHKGIDISGGGKEHPIYATQRGKVYINQYSQSGGYMVFIKHLDDEYYSCYMHLKEKSPIEIGQEVKKGEIIGIMGNTGYSSGIHLHFGISKKEIFNDSKYTINPEDYLKFEQ